MTQQRSYTVHEIDALRHRVETKYLFGRYGQMGGNGVSRSFMEADKQRAVEEQVRTWMLAGKTAQDLLDSEK